jgi:hypothetical protein
MNATADDLFGVAKAARFSPDGRYRYALLRRWGDDTDPVITFVMLNPSTADAERDDPTIRRCIRFARANGYGCLHVVNLFGLRATDPRALLDADDPVGPDNTIYLARHIAARSVPLVAAWGGHTGDLQRFVRSRVAQVMDRLGGHTRNWLCLGTTTDGDPRHPLFVRGTQPFIEWRPTDDRPTVPDAHPR